MKKTIIEKIQDAVTRSQGIPSSVIEYNFVLPEHPEITENRFFGVKAKFEPMVREDEVQLTFMGND